MARNDELNAANAQLKDALRRISTLERRFQNLMDFSPAGLLVVGPDAVIWYANQAAEALFRRMPRISKAPRSTCRSRSALPVR